MNVRTYREFEVGELLPNFETWDRICKTLGWPQTSTLGNPRACFVLRSEAVARQHTLRDTTCGD